VPPCALHHPPVTRELAFIEEQEHQTWAKDFKPLLLAMKVAVEQARARGERRLGEAERRPFLRRSEELLAAGRAANPPRERQPGQKGRPKPSPARNLLERLWKEHGAVRAFLDDFTVPCDNNQAEQDLRMPEGSADNRRVVPCGHGLGSLRAYQGPVSGATSPRCASRG
jgi:transposase